MNDYYRVRAGIARRAMGRLCCLAVALAGFAGALRAQDFKKQVIYQIVTDRFYDGDPGNNNPAVSPGLFDPAHKQWWMYWGGDLDGVRQKLAYLADMGVTAIWISPPLDNVNVPIQGFGGNTWTGYHGYWTRDFKRIEEHFGDASNSWKAFDALAQAAHERHIKLIVDFAPNHSNPDDRGEFGALYDDGKLLAKPADDPNHYFHHNPAISNYDDAYQVQYDKLFDLADLNQENPVIDRYLKDAARQLQDHGADAFRVDAVKHCTWGWLYSLANAIYTHGPSFIFGEWFEGSTEDKLYDDSVKFANRSGMSLLDYPLNSAIRAVFSGAAGFEAIDKTLEEEDRDFARPLDLVTFVDNHDIPRLLSGNANQDRLNEAMAFVLTARGIPIIYYGDEQYLHNDTNGGRDPYDRNPMTAWDQTTVAYRMIRRLAELRQTNDALAYGAMQKRWMNPDVYIFEREFYGDVALVAINRSDTASYAITGLTTDLPAGRYADSLGGLMSGNAIAVSSSPPASGRARRVADFTLAPHAVAVWEKTGAVRRPEIGSIGPTIGQPGMRVTIAGAGFGKRRGTVLFHTSPLKSKPARILSWSRTSAVVSVPTVPPGNYVLELDDFYGVQSRPQMLSFSWMEEGAPPHQPRLASDSHVFTVLAAPLIPVTFTVRNVPALAPGAGVFMAGNVAELAPFLNWQLRAAGPMLTAQPPDYFLCVSVPAGAKLEFRFVESAYHPAAMKEGPFLPPAANSPPGTITERGAQHAYTVPPSGTGSVTVVWQGK